MESHLQFALHFSGDHGRPDEDAIAVENDCVAVFDGVTLLHQDPYPVPSPAAKAAEQGASAAIEYALSHIRESDFLIGCFTEANRAIRGINSDLGITAETVDFLSVQYAAAVGAIACFGDPVLHYAQINDCGVMLCRPNGSLISGLITQKAGVADCLKAAREAGCFSAGSPEEHIFVRRELINNPEIPFSEYVLTGEEVAISGVRTREIVVQEPLKVLVYSDGFVPLLGSIYFRNKILRAADAAEASEYVSRARNARLHTGEASITVLSIE